MRLAELHTSPSQMRARKTSQYQHLAARWKLRSFQFARANSQPMTSFADTLDNYSFLNTGTATGTGIHFDTNTDYSYILTLARHLLMH